jgi:hypothetical protein
MAFGDSEGILLKIKGDNSSAVGALRATRTEADALTASSSNLAGSFSSLVGPATLAATAIGAMAAAGIKLTSTLYDLSKAAAEYGSEIYDASQKTGLHAETLTALKFAADQAGSSFEQVTKGVVLFGAEVGKAAQGNDQAAAKMKALGVTSTDLRTALGQAVKTIYDAKSSTEQLTLASEAFGRKIGPDLIPLIKDAHGNLDELEKKAKELGITMSDEDVAAADAFGDQMDQLNAQIAGVAHRIGLEFMPVFLDMSKSVSAWLVQNKDEIADWSTKLRIVFQDVIRGFGAVVEYVKNNETQIRIALALVTGGGSEAAIFALKKFGEGVQGQQNAEIERAKHQAKESGSGFPTLPGDDTSSTKGRVNPPRTNDAGFRKFFEDFGFQVNRTFGEAINKGSLHPSGKAIDISTKGKTEDEIARLIAAAIEKGYRFVDERIKQPGIKQTGPHLHFEQNYGSKPSIFAPEDMYGSVPLSVLRNRDEARLGKIPGSVENIQKDVDAERDARIKGAREVYDYERVEAEKLMQENLARFAAESKTRVATIQAALAEGAITETDAAEQTQQIRFDQLKEELRYASDTNSLTADGNKAYLLREEINAQLLDDYREQLRIQRELKKALQDVIEEEQKRFQSAVERNSLAAGGIDPGQFRFNPETGQFEKVTEDVQKLTDAQKRLEEANKDLTKSWKELQAAMEDAANVQMAATDIGQMGLDLLDNMIGALENAIANWLLYGQSVGKALKQALAEELAHIAARAAIKALEATAEGFILLAFGQFDRAASAFTAAALYATLAVGAGLAAKALAPKQQAKPAGGVSAGASQRSGTGSTDAGQIYSAQDASVLNIGRNRPEQQVITLHIRSNDSHIVDVVETDARNNGRIKVLVQNYSGA